MALKSSFRISKHLPLVFAHERKCAARLAFIAHQN